MSAVGPRLLRQGRQVQHRQGPGLRRDVHVPEEARRRPRRLHRSWRSTATPSVTSGAPSTRSRPARWPCSSTASGGSAWPRTPGVDFEIGTAPMPVADDEADEYGKGFLSGTIIGIAAAEQEAERGLGAGEVHDDRHRGRRRLRQRHPQRAVHVRRAEVARPEGRPGLQDVPGHRPEPALEHPAGLRQRLDVPDDAAGLRLPVRVRQGEGPQGRSGEDRRADRHATSSRRSSTDVHAHSPREAPQVGASNGRLHVAVADRLRRLLRLSADLHRVLLVHEVRRLRRRRVQRAWRTGPTSSTTTPCSGRRCATPCGWSLVMVTLPGRLRPRASAC